VLLKTLQRSVPFHNPGDGSRSFSRSAGLLGIVTGMAALFGWSVLPAYIIGPLGLMSQIHPNTALGFVLVGFSLRLAQYDPVNPSAHTVCKLLRLSVGLLGLLSLIEIWLGWNIGISHLMVHDPAATPGPMPPAAALAFFLLGTALALLSAQRSLPCQIFALAVITITVTTLVACSYALLAPQAVPDALIMPVVTALVLLILSLGVLRANANRALMAVVTGDTEGGTMARRLLPASIVIPIVLGFLRIKGQEAGWFGPALGLVLHVVATMLVLALIVWWNAAALDRVGRENQRFGYAVKDTRTTMLEILQHVNNAVYAYDLQGHLVFFNAAAERLFGVHAGDVLRTDIYALIAPESAADARLVLSEKLIGGTGAPRRLVLRTAAGEQECDVMTVLVFDRNGNPVELFSLVAPLFDATVPRGALEPLLHHVGVTIQSRDREGAVSL
jgi:two-component system cell cycle sensor histidine kinase/response regulator CckA